jgi:hypothetical protein
MREIGEESGPLYQRIDAGLPDLPVLPSQKCSAPGIFRKWIFLVLRRRLGYIGHA